MIELATAKQIKSIDEGCGIDSRELMQNAAECLFHRIESCKSEYIFSMSEICVACGIGNNGGDGYALAILLYESGCNVKIVAAGRPAGSDALYYFSLCNDMNISIVFAQEESDAAADAIANADFIVDALFGIGLSRAPEEPYDELIEQINACEAFVFSVDIPSGIYADAASFYRLDGKPLCVKADVTSTFVMKKAAHVSYPTLEYCGDVYVEDIGIAPEAIAKESFKLFCPDDTLISELFAPRRADSNKGDYGTLVMLCGSDNMTGAACLAAESALRCGVGLGVCAAGAKTLNILQNKLSFPIFLPLECDGEDLYTEKSLAAVTDYQKASALLVGCGLSKSAAARQAVEHVIKNCTVPLILDADALNIIAEKPEILKQLTVPTVITPHPGEMARLCGCDVSYVQNNRTVIAQKFAREYGVTVLLKGSATVIASPDGRTAFNTSGSPALAKGGMGDILSGVIASLAAQGNTLFESAVGGAYIHGLAGEAGAELFSEYGLSPEDMPKLIAKVIKTKTAHKL